MIIVDEVDYLAIDSKIIVMMFLILQKPATLKMKLAFVMVRPALERPLQLKDINMKTQELYLLRLI